MRFLKVPLFSLSERRRSDREISEVFNALLGDILNSNIQSFVRSRSLLAFKRSIRSLYCCDAHLACQFNRIAWLRYLFPRMLASLCYAKQANARNAGVTRAIAPSQLKRHTVYSIAPRYQFASLFSACPFAILSTAVTYLFKTSAGHCKVNLWMISMCCSVILNTTQHFVGFR